MALLNYFKISKTHSFKIDIWDVIDSENYDIMNQHNLLQCASYIHHTILELHSILVEHNKS